MRQQFTPPPQATTPAPRPVVPPYLPATRRTNFRWVVCGLIFLATTINYTDRQIIGVLKPTIQKDLGWNEIDYSNIVTAFQFAYSGGQLIAGRLMDIFGVRIGYAVAVIAWSLAAMSHGLARSVVGFAMARMGLGLAEGGNFPGAIKTVTEWFPRRERALATGIFNSGSNVGACVTPLVVPFLALRWGWPAAFYFTGAIGLLWVLAWALLYRRPEVHPRVSPAELQHIRSDSGDTDHGAPRPGISAVLFRRATFAFLATGILTGPVWWFYLFWVPDFLNKRFGVDLKNLGPPLVTIYLLADVGSVAGGWLSSHLLRRGWSLNAARKTGMLACALAVTPVFFASITTHVWVAVGLIGLAAAAHQGWAANTYTFASDTTPERSISTLIGIGGLAGGIAGMFTAKIVGYVLQFTGSYYSLFLAASVMYVLAFLIVHALVPRIESPDETTQPR